MIAALFAVLVVAHEMRPAGSLESLPDPPVFKVAAPTAKDVEAAKIRAAGRALAGTHLAFPANALKKGKWQKRKDGAWIWRLQLQSANANGMRVHFNLFDVGTSTVWLYEPGGKKPDGPYSGKREEFWSGIVFRDSAVMEFAPADRKKTKKIPFAVDRISHQL